MSHQGVCGYDVYCHVRNPDQVYQNIEKQSKEISEKNVGIKLYGNEDSAKLSNLKKHSCKKYFERYFEEQAKAGPVVLPQIQGKTDKVVDTMEEWCRKANTSPSDLKGLVIHNFSFFKFLEKFLFGKLDKRKLCKELEIKNFRSNSEPIVIVYNPKQSVILLIRKSREKDLREEMEFCSDDMKIFLLLFGDECKQSRVKVICLLASNETVSETLKCEDCKKCIVPFEALQSYLSFQALMSKGSKDFNIKNTESINKGKVIAVSEKLIGCLAAAPYFENIPTFTKDAHEQMEHVLMLLTPEQKEIIYSDEKHLIIRGPYGSGKSVVACKIMEILLKELEESKKNELVYFICYDSKSALLTEIESIPNLKIHRHEGDKKLSELINDILKETNTENVHLFVDEYGGENLGKEEAETLNCIFKETFEDKFVVLVPQSVESERNMISKGESAKLEKNKFELLKETMTTKYLDLAMRNPIQIHNLILVTQKFLKEEKTKYRYPLTKPESKDSANQKNKYAKEASVLLKPKATVEKIARQVEHQNQPSVRESGHTGKSSSDAENHTQFAVTNLGPDEDFAIAQLPKASNDDQTVIVNHYRYVESCDIGHRISCSCNPELFEVDFEDTGKGSCEKLCALTCTFQKLNIHNSDANNKHVILHFDSSTNGIPEFLTAAFQLLKIEDKITSNYKDFKVSKSVLVCNFRIFRGLEHSNVTVYIDQDMYIMQHYLVEVMARCTNKLSVVVLHRSDALSKITKHWEGDSMEKQFIDHWKIRKRLKGKRNIAYDEDTELKLIKINCSSEKHKEILKIIQQHKKRNCDFNRKRKRAEEKAEENIRKRY